MKLKNYFHIGTIKLTKKTITKYPFVNIKPVFNLQFPQDFDIHL